MDGSRFRSGRDWHWDWRLGFVYSGVDLVLTYRWHHPLNHESPCSVLLCLIVLSRLDTDRKVIEPIPSLLL